MRSSRGRFATPADFPRHECSPYSRVHVPHSQRGLHNLPPRVALRHVAQERAGFAFHRAARRATPSPVPRRRPPPRSSFPIAPARVPHVSAVAVGKAQHHRALREGECGSRGVWVAGQEGGPRLHVILTNAPWNGSSLSSPVPARSGRRCCCSCSRSSSEAAALDGAARASRAVWTAPRMPAITPPPGTSPAKTRTRGGYTGTHWPVDASGTHWPARVASWAFGSLNVAMKVNWF